MIHLFIFILGTAIGSFLNVLIDRLPREESILGRSHCDHCKRTLQWHDLFPVVSFVILRGECKYCHKKIPSVIPLIEILTGVLLLITYNSTGPSVLEKIIYLGIVSCLIVIFFADTKYQIIPDSVQFVLLTFSIGALFVKGPISIPNIFIAGLSTMFPILFLFLVTHGRGMGFGDVKLAFTMGILLGMPQGFLAIYIAFILGAIIGIGLLFKGRTKWRSTIAFGPFLVIGTAITICFGDTILQYVKNLLL